MILVDKLHQNSDGTLWSGGLSARMRFTCHLTSDTSAAEMFKFVKSLGIPAGWIHNAHFDLAPSYRKKAIEAGAVEVSTQVLACRCYRRKDFFARQGRPFVCICGECAHAPAPEAQP